VMPMKASGGKDELPPPGLHDHVFDIMAENLRIPKTEGKRPAIADKEVLPVLNHASPSESRTFFLIE
jgi:hypothetical protein